MQNIISLLKQYYYVFLQGLWGTLWISGVVVFFGTILGLVIAIMRMSRFKPLKVFTDVYIEILRGTPRAASAVLFLDCPAQVPSHRAQ